MHQQLQKVRFEPTRLGTGAGECVHDYTPVALDDWLLTTILATN